MSSDNKDASQKIQTNKKKVIKKENKTNRKVLIGEDLEELKKVEEKFDTLKNKLANKL